MTSIARRTVRLAMLIACIFLLGCSGPHMVEVKGRVSKNGQPLKLGPQGVLEVILIPETRDEQGEYTSFPATVDYQDGTFAVPEKVPAGKYRITVTQLDPYPGVDKLKGAFSRQKSPIVRDMTGEPVEIDLAKPNG